jgi:hypothetical protein
MSVVRVSKLEDTRRKLSSNDLLPLPLLAFAVFDAEDDDEDVGEEVDVEVEAVAAVVPVTVDAELPSTSSEK